MVRPQRRLRSDLAAGGQPAVGLPARERHHVRGRRHLHRRRLRPDHQRPRTGSGGRERGRRADVGVGLGALGDSACCRARPASPPPTASLPARPAPRSATSSRPRASSSAARTGGTRGCRRPARSRSTTSTGWPALRPSSAPWWEPTWIGFPAVGTGARRPEHRRRAHLPELADVLRPHHPDRGGTARRPPGCVAVGGDTVARLTLLHPRHPAAPGPRPGTPTATAPDLVSAWTRSEAPKDIPGQTGHTPVDSGCGTRLCFGSVRGYADSRRPRDGGPSCRRPARSVRAKPPTTPTTARAAAPR